MIPGRIRNATRYLGAPAGWQPDHDGPCGHLAIADMLTTAGPGMVSVWEPTPDELERLNRGAKVILTVLGQVHPPVELKVGAAPGDVRPQRVVLPPPPRDEPAAGESSREDPSLPSREELERALRSAVAQLGEIRAFHSSISPLVEELSTLLAQGGDHG